MESSPKLSQITQLLAELQRGDSARTDELLQLVYDDLRRLARARLAHEAQDHTLQPTALVHEAYLRLFGDAEQRWDTRGHFFAAAAEAMRRILIESARNRQRLKRGGDRGRADLFEHDLTIDAAADEILAVDDALERLGGEDELAAKILKLKYYGGLTVEDAADALGVSRATAYRHWTYARAWVRAELLDNNSE